VRARAVAWALAVAVLAAGAGTFGLLRPLAQLADRRDPIAILEHPHGGLVELIAALARLDQVRAILLLGCWLAVLTLAVLAWRWRVGLRGAAIGMAVGVAVLVGQQGLRDRRAALRTLCWAAQSGVYDRATRERALRRAEDLLGSPLGRLAEALGAHARPSCTDAARALGAYSLQ
jgi:hypothetical protein